MTMRNDAQKTANELYVLAFEHAKLAQDILRANPKGEGSTIEVAKVLATLANAYATMAVYRDPNR